MVDLICCLTNLFFFDIRLLYYTNFNSLIVCYVFSGDICLSFDVSISFSAFSKLLCDDFFEYNFFEALFILSAILLSIISPVASDVF